MKILFALIFSLTVYSFSIDEIIHAVSFHFPDNIWNKELQTEATDLCKTYLRLSAQNEFFECSKKTCPSILDSNIFKLRENEARLLLEVIHKRRRKSSTIFCSQFEEKDWYDQICEGESTLADAIMDRISFNSYKINIEYVDKSVDKSMREVYGLNPSEAQ